MDDFLHNLRSGKLKQQDRGRSYSDPQYKGGPRRNTHQDRRKKEVEAFERLNAVKEVLEVISGTQKRMAEAYEARTIAENRKARAMEVLAKNIYCMLNPDAKDVDKLFDSEPVVALTTEPVEEPVIEPDDQIESSAQPPETQNVSNDETKKLTESQRQTLYTLISEMRDGGSKWEQIARDIASQGYPTVSGKGTWRGAMAKNIYEKMNA
ncbi:MAG: hypothetical protein PVJ84_06520 [Desulfobacteraceae bacterium]|jgi:superfamily II RNA helicase